jgi:ice-binding like protein
VGPEEKETTHMRNRKMLSMALLTALTVVIGSTGCGDADRGLPGGAGPGGVAGPVVALGAAGGCAILGATPVVSNIGPTIVTGGDVCISPALSFTGWLVIDAGPGVLTLPAVFRAPSGLACIQCGPNPDPLPANAQLDWIPAYNALVARPAIPLAIGDLSGLTLTPGTYKAASSLGILSPAPGPLSIVTLDGLGDTNAVFVFQVGSALTTNTGTQVKLVNGTQAKNVYWAVGSSATLGVNSTFNGNILALASITLDTGATLNGRALAHTGAVTLDSNHVTVP